jgi:HSP20 family protein
MANIIKKDDARTPVFGNVVDQIFQNNLSRFFDDSFFGSSGLRGGQPPVNVREQEKMYEVELYAPGLKKQDFHLGVDGDTLTISYEKEENKEITEKTGWVRREYSRQSFNRSFTLDETIDAGKISAKYEDGVLRLMVPKKENAQRIHRDINIQ